MSRNILYSRLDKYSAQLDTVSSVHCSINQESAALHRNFFLISLLKKNSVRYCVLENDPCSCVQLFPFLFIIFCFNSVQ